MKQNLLTWALCFQWNRSCNASRKSHSESPVLGFFHTLSFLSTCKCTFRAGRCRLILQPGMLTDQYSWSGKEQTINFLIYKHKLIKHTEKEGRSYKYANPCFCSITPVIRNSAQMFFYRTCLKNLF